MSTILNIYLSTVCATLYETKEFQKSKKNIKRVEYQTAKYDNDDHKT